uniref:Cyclin-like domain-containing protein n=1 Tax=Leersia perrieri TaxID=77586 RepID=A0A0D9WZ78_9ORYZ
MIYGSPDGVHYCQNCDRVTPMLFDYTTGNSICTECVLVLSNVYANQPCRAAAAKDVDSADNSNNPGRATDVSNGTAPLLPHNEVAAAGIAPPKLQADDAGSAAPRMRGAVVPKMPKMRGAVSDTNKALAEGFDAIANMATQLGLADTVINRAKDVLRKLEESKACPKGRSRDALYAACLHTACRIEGSPRTLKELIMTTPDAAATKRDMGKFINAIKRHVDLGKEESGQDQPEDMKRTGGMVVRAGDYLLRYGSAVGMSEQEVIEAQRAASRLEESLDVRRNPQSIAAAIIHMAVQRSSSCRNKSVREVSAATGVSESTIKEAYKDLRPHAALLFECVLVLGNVYANQPCRAAAATDVVGADDSNNRGRATNVGNGAVPLTPDSVVAAAGIAQPKLQADDAGSAAPRMRGAVVPKMPKMRGAVSDTNKALAEGFDAIANMATQLGLVDTVINRAKDVLRKLEESKECPKGRSRDALYAACLHTACRIEGSPRTLKELIRATPDAAATKRDMGKFINAIKRHVDLGKEESGQDQPEDMKKNGGVVVRAGDYLLRYGSAVCEAQRAASRLEESLDVRRNPQSIAAAIIHMAVQRSSSCRNKSVREVSTATGVSESTIKEAYKHCQRVTPMVLDHTTGDAICTECVFVFANVYADQPLTAAPAIGDGAAAAHADPLPPAGSEVATPVLRADDADSKPRMRGAVVPKMRGAAQPKMRAAVPETNKALAEGFGAIADMARRLGLADAVSERAKEVLRKLEEAKACPKGRSRDALYAACLHTACRVEGSPRTLKELITATPDAAATKRDMGKFINAIKRHVDLGNEEAGQEQADTKTNGSGASGFVVRAGDYLVRYGSAVGLSEQEVNTARRAASRLDERLDVRRNPQSIAAAIIYMAVQRSDGGRSKSFREVSAATAVSESTIKDAYKDLCPHATLLFG